MAQPNTDVLDALKKFILPGVGDIVSPSVVENDPALALPALMNGPGGIGSDGTWQASPDAQLASNERVKQMLGLGPSPALIEQQKLLNSRDEAINNARIQANPEVTAEADKAYKEKLGLAGEPNRVSGGFSLAGEKLKSQAALDVERQKQAPLQQFMDQQAAGTTAGEPTGMTFKPTVNESGISFTGVEQPQQVRNQEHAAQQGLNGIGALRQIVDTLNTHNAIGPAAGRLSDALVGSGLDAYLMNPDAAQKFNDFKTQASMLKGNIALAHSGGRGGANPALMQRFDDLINAHQSAAGLKGGLDAFERWLTGYANAKSSADLDAADASLGIGGGVGQDPYQNPNYQPK